MIYHINTTMILPGKDNEAQQVASKFTTHVNQTYPGMHVQILTNISGASRQIHWVATYASLADFEEIGKKIGADPTFLALLQEGGTAIDFHNSVDSFYRVIA